MILPTEAALRSHFTTQSLISQRFDSPNEIQSPKKRSTLFLAWSAVDDVKSKASQLSSEARNELAKASQAAGQKPGQIELYSLQFYATSVLGGILACVSIRST